MAESLGQLEISDSRVPGVTCPLLLLEEASFSYSCLQEDYRVIVPNLRGFGGSTQPGDVQSSGTVIDAVGDMLCILKHANVAQAVVIGQVGSPVRVAFSFDG